ncbi:MAG: low molecular weight protein-tyrosine-phosphatase [Vicingaceae bacterium]
MKVLMVCLGNICRSPMAEGILSKKLKDTNLNVSVDSAATSDYHINQQPDERAIANCKTHGIDISNLRGRQFSVEDFDEFDRIFVMDSSNYENVVALARNEEDSKKVQLILNLSQPNSNISVPDPYFGAEDGFENVYQLLDAACDILIEELK